MKKLVGKYNTNYGLLYKCQIALELQPIAFSDIPFQLNIAFFWWTLNSSKQSLYWSYHCSHWSTFIYHVNTVFCNSCYWLPNICPLSNNLPTLFTAVSLCDCLVFQVLAPEACGEVCWGLWTRCPCSQFGDRGRRISFYLWTVWCMAMIFGIAAIPWVHEGSCCLVVQLIHHEWQKEDLERI